jgi:hypothetical protein
MQSGMLLIWIGALLIVGGIVLAHRMGSTGSGATLEPRERVRALHPKHHWPSIVMVALGIVLLLAEAAV